MKSVIVLGVIIVLFLITMVSAVVNVNEENLRIFQGVVIGGPIKFNDTNASTACSGAEYLAGNGTCLSVAGVAGDTDTNASTACSGTEVLLGNGTCVEGSIFDTNISVIPDTNASNCGDGEYLDGDGSCNDFNLTVNNFVGMNYLNLTGTNADQNINIGVFDFSANDVFFDEINFSRLISNFGGVLDVAGDPWFLSGVNLQIDDNITSSFFIGDGSQLTNLPGLTDTNASNCAGPTDVLLGNGTCLDLNVSFLNIDATNAISNLFIGPFNFTTDGTIFSFFIGDSGTHPAEVFTENLTAFNLIKGIFNLTTSGELNSSKLCLTDDCISDWDSVNLTNVNNSNSTDFWDNLDDPSDILGNLIQNTLGWLNLTQILESFWNMTQIEERYHNKTEIDDFEFVNSSFVSDNYVNVTGDTMTGNLILPSLNASGNITVGDRFILTPEGSHWIKLGSEERFNGISTESMWFNHEEEHPEGTIAFLGTVMNNTLFFYQSGLNNSFGGAGNSWGLIPNDLCFRSDTFNNGTHCNMSTLSNYLEICDWYNISCQFSADTTGRGGPLLFTTGDLEIFRETRLHEGIFSTGSAIYDLQGNDFDMVNGSLHLRTEREETRGFEIGDNVTILNKNFDNGALSPFNVVSSGLPGDWIIVSDAACHDDLCARSQGGIGSPLRRMEANMSTINISSMNLTFFLTTNLGGADSFELFVDNNVGSGEVSLFSTGAIILDEFQNVALPASMDNESIVSIIFDLTANNINFDVTYLDNVFIFGNATANTTINVTVFDTTILGGTGDGTISIVFNGTTDTWVFSPGNFSFQSVTEIDVNVTNSITLSGETITDWNNISSFDDNVVLRDGTRTLTANWAQGVFNFTNTISRWFGTVNWSSILNAPTFALASDVVSWIGGNRTASETNMLGNISQVNTTANIENLNFTQGSHTTNCNSTGSCSSGDVAYMSLNANSGNFNITGNFSIINSTIFNNGTHLIWD